jgi:AraC-like DNA-binding protein
MEWINNLNDAIDYIEQHITDEIDYNAISQRSACSVYNFQRLFSFILNMPLSEYIRYRRLTLAAIEIQNSDLKIVDIAVKYGYESHEAFSRAFYKFHGIVPSAAKKKGVVLKYCSKASFKINITGGIKMHTYITGKDSSTIPQEFSIGQVQTESFSGARCPEMQPLTGSIRACLDYMGENYGFIDNNGARLDKGFIYACNLLGEAYGGDATVMCEQNTLANSMIGIQKLFNSLNYEFEIYSTDPGRSDYLPYDLMKQHIKNHLSVKKRPVITDGIWNVPMGYAVVGYEDGGDTLIGWNYHVFDFSPNPTPVTDKKSDWYADASFVILLGEQKHRVAEKNLYKLIIHEAYNYLTDGKSMSNAEFYDDLKRFLNQTEDKCISEAKRTRKIMGYATPPASLFEDDEAIRAELARTADPIWCCVSERRYYAAHFFETAKIVFPEHSELLSKTAGCFWSQSGLFGSEYLKEVGHDPVDREKFRDMDVRARMAEVVEQARREEENSIKLIKELIDCMEA